MKQLPLLLHQNVKFLSLPSKSIKGHSSIISNKTGRRLLQLLKWQKDIICKLPMKASFLIDHVKTRQILDVTTIIS